MGPIRRTAARTGEGVVEQLRLAEHLTGLPAGDEAEAVGEERERADERVPVRGREGGRSRENREERSGMI